MAPINEYQSGKLVIDTDNIAEDGDWDDAFIDVPSVENAHDQGTPQQYGSKLTDNATWLK